jgi:hypothetical protein
MNLGFRVSILRLEPAWVQTVEINFSVYYIGPVCQIQSSVSCSRHFSFGLEYNTPIATYSLLYLNHISLVNICNNCKWKESLKFSCVNEA